MFDSGPWPHAMKTMWSTKPEVLNVRNAVRGRPSNRYTKNWWRSALYFSSYESGQTNKQTNRHTHHNTSHPFRRRSNNCGSSFELLKTNHSR